MPVPLAPLLLAVPLPLPRKSVTYQPEPFNWKPAAVSCFRKLSLLQEQNHTLRSDTHKWA